VPLIVFNIFPKTISVILLFVLFGIISRHILESKIRKLVEEL